MATQPIPPSLSKLDPITSLLFLNNNLHRVHHDEPTEPWYRLPQIYKADRKDWRRRAGGYTFSGYGEVARRFLLKPKEPVAYPLISDNT